MASIQLLVGSVMGTAEAVAAVAAEELRRRGHQTKINVSPNIDDIIAAPDDVLLLCTSNTGAGDLPDNIQPLYLQLTREYPAIAGRRYGVINLGDSSYSTFNEGGRALAAAFADLGGVRLGEPLVLDASEGEDPEALTRAWVIQWQETL